MTQLTYRQAAQRVRRSIRTINRWRRGGMPMGWERRDGQNARVVDEQILLAYWRARMAADPVHTARVQARQSVSASRPQMDAH